MFYGVVTTTEYECTKYMEETNGTLLNNLNR